MTKTLIIAITLLTVGALFAPSTNAVGTIVVAATERDVGGTTVGGTHVGPQDAAGQASTPELDAPTFALPLITHVSAPGASVQALPCEAATDIDALPAAAEGTGWTPACADVDSGATVNFHEKDAITHQPKSVNTCFDLGRFATATPAAPDLTRDTLSMSVIAFDGGVLVNANFCPADGVSIVDTGATVDIHYICAIHGAQLMSGVVRVAK